jgi:hypothetical protein
MNALSAASRRQVEIEAVKPGRHVARDRRVGKVELEHANASWGHAGREWQIHLDGLITRATRVIGVGVDPRQDRNHVAGGSIERLIVVFAVAETRVVVREHDLPGEIS